MLSWKVPFKCQGRYEGGSDRMLSDAWHFENARPEGKNDSISFGWDEACDDGFTMPLRTLTRLPRGAGYRQYLRAFRTAQRPRHGRGGPGCRRTQQAPRNPADFVKLKH